MHSEDRRAPRRQLSPDMTTGNRFVAKSDGLRTDKNRLQAFDVIAARVEGAHDKGAVEREVQAYCVVAFDTRHKHEQQPAAALSDCKARKLEDRGISFCRAALARPDLSVAPLTLYGDSAPRTVRPEIRHWANRYLHELASLGLAVRSLLQPFACVERNRDFRELFALAVTNSNHAAAVTRSDTPGTFTR